MDAQKILADAIKTIGRTMPVGMVVFFFRDEGMAGAGMTIVMPDGTSTEYRFRESFALPAFNPSTLEREVNLERAIHDLIETIDLHTDCMSNQIDREALEPSIDKALVLLADGWQPDDSHPANRTDSPPETRCRCSIPATVSYPTGSLGESIDDQGWLS